MNTIRPVNGHILIEPLAHESFISTHKDQYDEIGIVIDCGDEYAVPKGSVPSPMGFANAAPRVFVKEGDRVYFDSWLAAKYPKNDKEWYWLVKWEDVRAIEHVEP